MESINKILNIRLDETSDMTQKFNSHTMKPLVIEINYGFWMRKKFKLAKPLDVGPTYGGDEVRFPLWVDEVGERYGLDACERFTDFCKTN